MLFSRTERGECTGSINWEDCSVITVDTTNKCAVCTINFHGQLETSPVEHRGLNKESGRQRKTEPSDIGRVRKSNIDVMANPPNVLAGARFKCFGIWIFIPFKMQKYRPKTTYVRAHTSLSFRMTYVVVQSHLTNLAKLQVRQHTC